MDECIFCLISQGRIPSEKVLENEDFLAFRDIHPKAPQHVLVIPRDHIVSLNDIDDWEQGQGHELLRFIVRVAEHVGVAESGYRVLTNVGRDGGQEVGHLHFHLLGGEDLGDFR